MTTYNGSALTNGQKVAFVPGADIIHIDDASISAAPPRTAADSPIL